MGDFYLNLRHAPLVQVQHSNWSIAYTNDQLVKIKSSNGYNPGTPVFTHFTSARRRYALVTQKDRKKIERVTEMEKKIALITARALILGLAVSSNFCYYEVTDHWQSILCVFGQSMYKLPTPKKFLS